MTDHTTAGHATGADGKGGYGWPRPVNIDTALGINSRCSAVMRWRASSDIGALASVCAREAATSARAGGGDQPTESGQHALLYPLDVSD